MNHILAVDYGLKRTGIAFAIYPILIAHPYKTVPTKELDFYLEEYIRTNTVTTILIGLPLKMNQNNEYRLSLKGSENFLSNLEIKKNLNGYDISFNLSDDLTNLGENREALLNLNKVF